MTILIHFHQSRYRGCKSYDALYVRTNLVPAFPGVPRYARVVALMPRVRVPLYAYLTCGQGHCTGLSFIDSTPRAVCHHRRLARHRVSAGIVQRGQNPMGWFFGFQLHVVVNARGAWQACALTPGTVDDRKSVPRLTRALWGKFLGEKGYIAQALAAAWYKRGLQLIARLRSHKKPKLMLLTDPLWLRRRALIESIHDPLKHISQVEHTRHRSPANFLVNLVSGLIAYCHQPRKLPLRLGCCLA